MVDPDDVVALTTQEALLRLHWAIEELAEPRKAWDVWFERMAHALVLDELRGLSVEQITLLVSVDLYREVVAGQ